MPLFLAADVLLSVLGVVAALSMILWRARTSKRDGQVAVAAAIVLALWGILAIVLAYNGFFQPPNARSFPPVGINLIVVFLVLSTCLIFSGSLRRLLSQQTNLIRIHVWRILAIVFLILMVMGQLPALWSLPAGIGDILIGVAAFPVARGIETRGGRRRAVIFNLFGMADLIVAVALGLTTNPGPAQVFHTTPTSVLLTRFPLILVPTFLVPLAFTIHVVSLWQLLGFRWATSSVERRRLSRLGWEESGSTRLVASE